MCDGRRKERKKDEEKMMEREREEEWEKEQLLVEGQKLINQRFVFGRERKLAETKRSRKRGLLCA